MLAHAEGSVARTQKLSYLDDPPSMRKSNFGMNGVADRTPFVLPPLLFMDDTFPGFPNTFPVFPDTFPWLS